MHPARNEQHLAAEHGFRLGKHEAASDARTFKLAKLADLEAALPQVPDPYDFDRTRKFPFSDGMYGNDEYGDCVKAAMAKQWKRLERAESLSLYEEGLTDEQVIDAYKLATGCVSPGDENDTGLEILAQLRWWRSSGWPLSLPGRPRLHAYKIAAFGSLDPSNLDEIIAAAFLLRGVLLGLNLPLTALDQSRAGQAWDYVPNSARNQAGSWGGHCVFSKKRIGRTLFCMTWGKEQPMSEAFLMAYMDEAYAVVDDLDAPSKYLNVNAMKAQLASLGVQVQT